MSMKALAIIALVFAGLSIFIPVVGVFIAIVCSVLALISFRSQPTLSGITFGINIINTAFLSPSIVLSDAASSGAVWYCDKCNRGADRSRGTLLGLRWVSRHSISYCCCMALKSRSAEGN